MTTTWCNNGACLAIKAQIWVCSVCRLLTSYPGKECRNFSQRCSGTETTKHKGTEEAQARANTQAALAKLR